jgi:signal transduction histidine kinase
VAIEFKHWAELIDHAASVSGRGELAAVMRFSVRAAKDVTGARYAALGVVGSNGELAEFVHVGLSAEETAAIGQLPRGRGLLGTMVKDASIIRLDDLTSHPSVVGFPLHHPPMTAFLGVPVRVGGEVFGSLYLTDKPGGFTAEDEELVEAVAVAVGAAVAGARTAARLRRLAIVEDRERIARDLHDSIIQDLFAVGLQLQAASLRTDDPVIGATVEDAVGRLDAAIGTLRDFIFGLRRITEGSDFASQLGDAVGAVTHDRDLTTSVVVSPPQLKLPESVADHIVQIVREASSNAVRHGRPSRLEIVVASEDSRLTLAVVDDGVGFDPAAVPMGMGLLNIARRVDELDGLLRIESSSGQGTSLHISLPLPR